MHCAFEITEYREVIAMPAFDLILAFAVIAAFAYIIIGERNGRN